MCSASIKRSKLYVQCVQCVRTLKEGGSLPGFSFTVYRDAMCARIKKKYILYSVCTVCAVQCAVCSVQFAVCAVECSVCAVQCAH